MTVIVCVDDKMGMMFGRRRQSKDRVLIRHITEAAAAQGKNIWMNAYSAGMFAECGEQQIEVDEDFLSHAPEDALCFVEDKPLAPYADSIDRIILYRWNRRYPGNLFFDLPLETYTLESSTEFPGYSHDTITEEIYFK